jgi:hypothetical protein
MDFGRSLCDRYEELRATVTRSRDLPVRAPGLDLLLRRGVAAWMLTIAHRALPLTSERAKPGSISAGMPMAAPDGEMPMLLANMALSGRRAELGREAK